MHPTRSLSPILFAVCIGCGAIGWPSGTKAQCSKWLAGPLDNGTATNGAEDDVETLTVWTPPGATSPMLVVGGQFDSVQGVPAEKIAARDGITGDWQALGAGLPVFEVEASATYNGELYAADTDNPASIFRWNGSAWETFAVVEGIAAGQFASVFAFAEFNGELIAAGDFYYVDGVFAPCIARWNGTSWSALGSGMSPLGEYWTTRVYALAVANDELIAGGMFERAGGQLAPNIARWNGTSWSAFSTSLNGPVRALKFYSYQDPPPFPVMHQVLVAGGEFTHAGTTAVNHITACELSLFCCGNYSAWGPMGAGFDDAVWAIERFDGGTYAGGEFLNTGGVSANRIARWNGTAWSAVGLGVGNFGDQVSALLAYNGELVVGGHLNLAGGKPVNHLARWNGSAWSSFGGGSVGTVDAMTTLGARLVAGGGFSQSTSVAQNAHNIVAFDGVNLTPFGTGMNGEVFALKTYNQPAPSEDRELVAGGNFTTAGGMAANRIARWVENPLNNPPAQWAPMGAGFNNWVFAIERVAGTYVAGGLFTLSGATGINRIALWNESNGTWSQLQGGMNNTVWALKFYTQQDPPPFPVLHQYLVASGDFTTAGGAAANRIAISELSVFCCNNFSAWAPMGQGFNGSVRAIERFNGSTYVGGAFSASGATTVNGIARWTGSAWLNVGNFNGPVLALKASGNYLYAAGVFTAVNGIPTNNIARFNGVNWEAVSGGPDIQATVTVSLAAFNNEIHVGGPFDNVGAPPIASPGWGRFLQTGVPWIAQQPSSQTLGCGGDANFAIQPAQGYDGLSFQWRKGGVPLSNGPTGTGSTVSGADTANLAVALARNADAGSYDCVITNTCGSATSLAATLTVTGCLAGDLDGDGQFDTDDVAPFSLSLIDLAAYQQQYPNGNSINGDMNNDLSLDGKDIGPFVVCLINGACQ